jgi:hypothetical protein
MPIPGLGSISAIIHMLAKGPDIVRSKGLLCVLGALFISVLACLVVVHPVSGDMPLSAISSAHTPGPTFGSKTDFHAKPGYSRRTMRKLSDRAISPTGIAGLNEN